eukprot:CAMPEP_0113310126 /NCGR_PEP_ID=MMETSP0010_2-20120614/7895_1 /TAXON_ID=216773 ORGANISM="Corethron hystrix, Strain 308" /NCGR_SAMPLE_ID=MMETSP0010_2 /ASSEMBLY_ACC=CAM_ASM_000155 /LENGTH=1128 /DNA_ID=CAMNT_0000165517 /DNA_START=777 /DNA_END=4163 /DNA_ORIENTATION=+ /assembly_acc=CAM_ASM_000155
MAASFHPSDDLIVSASLDQTVRVWDTTGLRKKQTGEASPYGALDSTQSPGPMGLVTGKGNTPALNMQAELFGTNDVVVKYVLEGHDRGVNWASFHPTLPLLVSAADDRQVKLWRMSETKAWEVDTLRGHSNNVSCVLFHPRHELIVSNSEDRSIRVWDMSKRVGVQTFRRESDRFWIMACHRDQNLIAAGHDGGMIVFKLERERPAASVSESTGRLYFVKGRELYVHDYGRGGEHPIANLRRTVGGGAGSQTDGIGNGPRYLNYNQFNPSEGNILVTSEVDGGSYELLTFALGHNASSSSVSDGKRGSCTGPAVFIGRNRFVVLDKSRQLVVRNLQNEVTKKVASPVPTVDGLLDGGSSGRVLLRAEDKLILFEHQSRRTLGEIHAPKARSAHWTADGQTLAIVCKYGVVIANRSLEQLASLSETVRVKSGAWDLENSVFVYTTMNHVKYCLPNGDSGIIRTIDHPLYVSRVEKNTLYALNREAKCVTFKIDLTEALFKLALEAKQYKKVMEMVRNSRLCGQAIIAYLTQKGWPEVALHFVRDPKTRFKLALACGDLEAAMDSAFQLKDDSGECWRDIGAEALRQGNHQVVEMSYQKTKDFDRLSFLYMLTGNSENLKKMLKIATMRKDTMGRYNTALFLGDAAERVRVLEETGNHNLAFVCAKIHSLDEEAGRIASVIVAAGGTVEGLVEAATAGGGSRIGCLLQPPTPIVRANNWPTISLPKHSMENMENVVVHDISPSSGEDAPEKWGEDEFDESQAAKGSSGVVPTPDDDLDLSDVDAWDEDDLEFGDEVPDDYGIKNFNDGAMPDIDNSGCAMPKAGQTASAVWVSNSSHAADHAAAGSMETAMQLLHRQVAIAHYVPLKSYMVGAFLGAQVSIPFTGGSCSLPLFRNDASGFPGKESLPLKGLKMRLLELSLKESFRAFQGGKFTDAMNGFMEIIQKIPLTVTDGRNEGMEVKEMLEICREYITALRIKIAIGETEDPVRSTELSAYFTHCNLQPSHLLLALRSAMVTSFKHKNFIVAASFARRLLELPDVNSARNAQLRVKATKVLQKSEQMARNENELNYDAGAPFVVDCASLVPLYPSDAIVKCSYCGSTYGKEWKGSVCLTCQLSKVGEQTLGLVTGK